MTRKSRSVDFKRCLDGWLRVRIPLSP